jgi:SAM-dependent methyltransferase
MNASLLPQAAITYDRLAPYYDEFTAGYAYERWVAALEDRAIALGLAGNRALDLACGTGKSTEQLIARGYEVMACDVSEEMLDRARKKFPDQAESFFWADMRSLPEVGEFDLVLCLDDAINYLLTEDELEAAFSGVATSLAASGLFIFDLNSLLTYRQAFSEIAVREAPGTFFAWRGEASGQFAPGDLACARVEIFSEEGDGMWKRSFARHTQRHHSRAQVVGALGRAGLECCAVVGQRRGAVLEESVDETEQIKVVYFARRSGAGG